MDLVPGQQRLIGDGPVATVYSGVRDGVPVAVKVFPAKLDRRTLSAFERERNRLASVSSVPSILPVWGVEALSDGRPALWTELCGQSLAALVRRIGPLTVPDVIVLGYALAAALAAAHSAGVVHGGVSPNNALFRASGEPVLADFGVVLRYAFARDPLYAIEFLAPETVRDQTLDERTDLYGLGATLHFALTGQAPHPGRLGEQPGERVLRVLRSPVPAINRPDLPATLSTLVVSMLATDPAHRPADVSLVADQLVGMLGDQPGADGNDDADPDGAASTDGGDGTDGADGDDGSAAPRSKPAPDPSAVDGLRPDFGLGIPPPAQESPDRLHRVRGRLVIAAALAVPLIISLLLLGRTEPDELTTTPRTPPPPLATSASGQAHTVQLELAEPTDHGDHVILNWTAASPNLDFAVVIAPEGAPKDVLRAGRNRTMRVPVDPNRKYCFRIRATDKLRIYDSPPRALHGAVCEP